MNGDKLRELIESGDLALVEAGQTLIIRFDRGTMSAQDWDNLTTQFTQDKPQGVRVLMIEADEIAILE